MIEAFDGRARHQKVAQHAVFDSHHRPCLDAFIVIFVPAIQMSADKSPCAMSANGTLIMLEATRKFCPQARFVFTSTNKVYGDNPNGLPLVELRDSVGNRPVHPTMPMASTRRCRWIRPNTPSSASRSSRPTRWSGIRPIFRHEHRLLPRRLSDRPGHSGTMMHGFLSYLVKCAMTGHPYTVFGYNGKQVRDNIHSLRSGQYVLAILPESAARRGVQCGWRPFQQLLDARGNRLVRSPDGPEDERSLQRRRIESATTSGTSAIRVNSGRTIRSGSRSMTCRGLSTRSSNRCRRARLSRVISTQWNVCWQVKLAMSFTSVLITGGPGSWDRTWRCCFARRVRKWA